MCGEVCYGQFRRLSLHRLTTVAVRTGAEEAVARLLTSGTLDLGDLEVCHSQEDQEAREDRDRLEEILGPRQWVVAKERSPATGCGASVRCRSFLPPLTGRGTGSGG